MTHQPLETNIADRLASEAKSLAADSGMSLPELMREMEAEESLGNGSENEHFAS